MLLLMNSGLEAMVRTGTGLSERGAIETGLRQGGRFFTTGAKLALQHLNECLRTLTIGIHIGYPDQRCHDLEFADDEMLLADDLETFTTACRLFSDSVEVQGYFFNTKIQVRIFSIADPRITVKVRAHLVTSATTPI